MAPARGELRERREDEAALLEAGVGQGRISAPDDSVEVEDVEVDFPGSVPLPADAAQVPLDLLQREKELARRRGPGDFRDRVVKVAATPPTGSVRYREDTRRSSSAASPRSRSSARSSASRRSPTFEPSPR
jgi:hypothetical protein